MNDQGSGPAPTSMPDIEAWLGRLGEVLPPGALGELGSAEREVLLDLARIAAHQSHRSAAPITTYAIGLTVARLSRVDRLSRMQALARELDVG
ncbi:MAG: DUF6457 domain-containing protein [Anaerolineaceae bacterium]